jgi:6-methylsalicylate decarboxylase
LYTQCEGLYLGDPFYDPIFTELDRRAATVFVHPVAPEPEVKLKGVCSPAIEYPFDTTRAIANLSFTGSRKRYPNIKFIFSHGGGTLPFLADRIVGQASLPFQGGRNPAEVIRELKGYYFDLAGVTSAPQLAALDAFVGSSQLVSGSDGTLFHPTQAFSIGYLQLLPLPHVSINLLLTT